MDLLCNTTAAVTAAYLKLKRKKKLNRHFIIETLCVANTIVGKVLELSFTVTAKTKCDFFFQTGFSCIINLEGRNVGKPNFKLKVIHMKSLFLIGGKYKDKSRRVK